MDRRSISGFRRLFKVVNERPVDKLGLPQNVLKIRPVTPNLVYDSTETADIKQGKAL